MGRKIPEMSHLQVAVLGLVAAGDRKGLEIRDRLGELQVRQTGPAFYQMMARLEEGKLIEGWYAQRVVAGQMIKERHYRITPAGRRAWREAQAFYRQLLASGIPEVARA
jgi:DNA-binding PadR family transcriptional regulator